MANSIGSNAGTTTPNTMGLAALGDVEVTDSLPDNVVVEEMKEEQASTNGFAECIRKASGLRPTE